jgi:hypothetical protein
MSAVECQIEVPPGGLVYDVSRKTRTRGTQSDRQSIEIAWSIEERLAESSSFDCDLDSAKIGVDVVDQRIPMDELWLQAEKKDGNLIQWRWRVE